MLPENAFFAQAIKDVKDLDYKPDNNTLLQLYAYYKQATIGDNNIAKPSLIDFKGVAKWQAWYNIKDMSKLTAKVNYIKLVKKLQSS